MLDVRVGHSPPMRREARGGLDTSSREPASTGNVPRRRGLVSASSCVTRHAGTRPSLAICAGSQFGQPPGVPKDSRLRIACLRQFAQVNQLRTWLDSRWRRGRCAHLTDQESLAGIGDAAAVPLVVGRGAAGAGHGVIVARPHEGSSQRWIIELERQENHLSRREAQCTDVPCRRRIGNRAHARSTT